MSVDDTARRQENRQANRQAMMGLFARATAEELDAAVDRFRPLPAIHDLRPAEVGLAMVRGRIGGDGAPFNAGEATVTRAAVRIEGGATGVSYLIGRDPHRARLAAVLDGLWQDPALSPLVEDALAPVRQRLTAHAAVQQEKTQATKVNFFTMVRGED